MLAYPLWAVAAALASHPSQCRCSSQNDYMIRGCHAYRTYHSTFGVGGAVVQGCCPVGQQISTRTGGRIVHYQEMEARLDFSEPARLLLLVSGLAKDRLITYNGEGKQTIFGLGVLNAILHTQIPSFTHLAECLRHGTRMSAFRAHGRFAANLLSPASQGCLDLFQKITFIDHVYSKVLVEVTITQRWTVCIKQRCDFGVRRPVLLYINNAECSYNVCIYI